MSYDWLAVEAKLDGFPPPDRHTLFTVNGTGVDMWTGYPADVARALGDEQYYWQPIGYPSAVFPMGKSVDAGVSELVNQINRHPGTFAMIGYSQGAIVTCKVWRDHILNPDGDLHHRLGDIFAHITYGNPMRAVGVANGNVYAGQPLPEKVDFTTPGGIAGSDDLTAAQTPDFQLDFANNNDLYTSCPTGDAGKVEQNIYDIVQKASFLNIISIAKDLTAPIGTVEAIINGLTFAAAGPTAGHWTYDIGPAIRYLTERGAAVPAREVQGAPVNTLVEAPVAPHVDVVVPTPPAPVPVPAPTPSTGSATLNLSTILSILKQLPKIREELVTGIATAGTAITLLQTLAPVLPGSVQAIITSVAGVVPMLSNFLKNNVVIEVVDEVGKL